ncbi:hypothetical protein AM1BK_15520 [Neobacillus kokaensis]|uniref:Uncharacterized protein n=1 Tax=Neobacillus kokaensis TaxID=2759023 RepID=A0ABQ3MZ99_9BACI|nr:hypothetical protein AM1BK_15520 [Neobacillus kokaensis]
MPKTWGNSKFWSMEGGCIAQNVGKLTILVKGKGLHCPKRGETYYFGQWEGVALPEKQGNSKFWSMEGGCLPKTWENLLFWSMRMVLRARPAKK